MKNKFERILLSLLLSISVLLGLMFWLNIIFGFNIFLKEHWDILAKMQAEHVPVSSGFYISIGIAIFVFVFGLCFIYVPVIRNVYKKASEKKQLNQTKTDSEQPQKTHIQHASEPSDTQTTEKVNVPQTPGITLSRPPKLRLPSNMAQIVAQQNSSQNQSLKPQDLHNQYDSVLSQMFTEGGYTVKPNPVIYGFIPNLFAIAPNEIVWIGAVNTDIDKLKAAIDKLQSVFHETLESIPIYVNAFLLDTTNQQTSKDSISVFHSLEELKTFVSTLPPAWPEDADEDTKDNFESYSEYIDTMIQYIKTMR